MNKIFLSFLFLLWNMNGHAEPLQIFIQKQLGGAAPIPVASSHSNSDNAATVLDIQAQNATVQPQTDSTLVSTSDTKSPQSWVLHKEYTLKKNLELWSIQRGWFPPLWDASNYFEVMASTTLQGSFSHVLELVANSFYRNPVHAGDKMENQGLNICVNEYEQYIRVTDLSTPCY